MMYAPIVQSIIGDAVPASLAAYYDAVDHGRLDEAAGQFSDDCLYAVPAAGIETQPLSLIHI